MKFQLRTLFIVLAFLAIGIALVLSRRELTAVRRYYINSVQTAIYNGSVGISQITRESILARVGEGRELRIRCATSATHLTERKVIEEFALGPGLYTMCLINDKKSNLFGCCVNDQLHVHSIPNDCGAAGNSGFGAPNAPDWCSVWNISSPGSKRVWFIELQQSDLQKITDLDESVQGRGNSVPQFGESRKEFLDSGEGNAL